MRFDDTLDTVLATDVESGSGAQTAWRQIVDLVGRGRAPADPRTMTHLRGLSARVPTAARVASARALEGASPPVELVRLLAADDMAVAAPVLRACRLAARDWVDLLAALTPAKRAILRHRRDLSPDVVRALESFGSVDFVLADESALAPVAAETPAPQRDPGPFVSLGAIARSLPVVAEALKHRAEPPAEPALFEIADVVARIEAFQRRQEEGPRPLPAHTIVTRLRFETDADGLIRWAEGAPREATCGISLARPGVPGAAGVDAAVSGAFRRRSRIGDGRLTIAGSEDGAGTWLISAAPMFDAATGRFTGYRGAGRRPRADEVLRSAPRASAPSADSLRQLVHELRTPTNAIAGFAEMIEHQMLGAVSEPYRDHATTIRREARALLSAIDDLDIAARIEARALPQTPAALPMATLLDRLHEELDALAAARGALLAIEAGDEVVEADARGVERLVARLAATMLGAAAFGERIAIRSRGGADVMLSVTRPMALAGRDAAALFALDDEASPTSLLGAGFALRLVRNLARELGGALIVEEHALTLRLPAAFSGRVDQPRRS